MPKRSYSNGTPISPLQLKTHVGVKEVNEGANKEENMKAVYDKTLNMMKEGAKKLAELEKESCKETEMRQEPSVDKPEIMHRQTYLSTQGSIKVAGVYEAVKESENSLHDSGSSINECNKEFGVQMAADDVVHTTEPVQRTTLGHVGFNLQGVKSSPVASPVKKESAKSCPVNLQKKPLDL